MYAIVEIAGQQFKVEKDQKLYVHRLDAERGSVVEFDKEKINNGIIDPNINPITNKIPRMKILSAVFVFLKIGNIMMIIYFLQK